MLWPMQSADKQKIQNNQPKTVLAVGGGLLEETHFISCVVLNAAKKTSLVIIVQVCKIILIPTWKNSLWHKFPNSDEQVNSLQHD